MSRPEAHRTILVIDDDRVFGEAVRQALAGPAREVLVVHTAAEGVGHCSRRRVDVVLLDQKLPDGEGFSFCPQILSFNEQTKIIFITAYPSFESAVRAVKGGAYDYLSKPFELEELLLAVERSCRTLDLEQAAQLQTYRQRKEGEETVLLGGSPALAAVRETIDLAAAEDAPVLITGETGTGKGVVARSIHYRGPRAEAPFVSINCAALPENIIETELFGHERGAFTGAVGARKGIFEMAEGGTLFLDEIGTMPLHLQSKLLGVLDEKRIRRLGGETFIPVDVRIVAATNAEIEAALRSRTFREDLYYRIGVIRLHMPPLRERAEDIPELCRFFLGLRSRGSASVLPEEEILRLQDYGWPGNVRELKNIIERAAILHRDILRPAALLGNNAAAATATAFPPRVATGDNRPLASLADVEREHIARVLAEHAGNYSRAARTLGISLSTLKRKLRPVGEGTVRQPKTI